MKASWIQVFLFNSGENVHIMFLADKSDPKKNY